MSATSVLIHLLGEIALLLWGITMVNSGVQRAFGSDLRWILGTALRTRLQAFLAGVGVTTVLPEQHRHGTDGVILHRGRAVDLVPALAVMLGANVGTTLIVQVLSFDVSLDLSGPGLRRFHRLPQRQDKPVKDLGPRRHRPGPDAALAASPRRDDRPIESSKVLKDLLAGSPRIR